MNNVIKFGRHNMNTGYRYFSRKNNNTNTAVAVEFEDNVVELPIKKTTTISIKGKEIEINKKKKEWSESYKPNFNVGVHTQTKEPIKDKEDYIKMREYFKCGKDKYAYRNMMLWVVGCNLSLRGSDLVKLVWGQIFDENGEFIIDNSLIEQKTKKYKVLRLNKLARETIMEYLNHEGLTPKELNLDGYVFASNKKKYNEETGELEEQHIQRVTAGRILKKASEELGLKEKVGSHTMRKTFGRTYYDNTKDIVKTMDILNQTSLASTIRYIGIKDEELRNGFDLVGEALED